MHPRGKGKRSLVRKTTVLLSSSGSESDPESLDDSEESNFVVDEGKFVRRRGLQRGAGRF